MKTLWVSVALVLVCVLSGCNGGSQPLTITVTAASASVQAGGTVQITATVANDKANKGVTWTVSCSAASCGSISPTTTLSGAATTYTAPSTPPASDLTVTITATSVSDSTKSVAATIKVLAITVAVAPTSATVNAGSSTTITPTVTNDPSATPSVTWTVSCATAPCGSVSPASTASGTATTYTAPTTPPTSNLTVTVKATSATDTTKSASSTITVPAISVAISPSSPTVQEGQTKQFTATVSGTSNQNVTWVLTCGIATCGSLSSNTSNPTTYTAPGPPASNLTVTITATSIADPTKSRSTSITVPAIAVSVSPNSPSVVISTTQNFTATVTNDPSATPSVTWTLSGTGCTGAACGTLSATSSASGTPIAYTAPATVPSPATVTLTATSVTDTTKTGTATITVTAAPACTSGGSESLLSGSYAILLKGLDSSGNPALVGGVLTFNGTNNNGLITAGTIDINQSSGFTSNAVTSGSYGVGSDHRGCMVITTSAGTQNYRFSLGNITSGVASTGHVIGFDTTGPFTAGVMRKQSGGSFSNASVNGSFAFGASSIQNTAAAVGGGKFAIVGVVTFDGNGGITGGSEDINKNGTLDGNPANTTWPASPLSINSGGAYSISPNGRGTLAITILGTTPTFNSALYVVSPSEALFMTSDSQTTNNIVGGVALQQTGAGSFTGTSLSGTYIGYTSALGSTTGTTAAELILVNISNPNITGTDTQKNGSSFGSQSIAATYTVTSAGRMVTAGGGSHPPVLYIVNSNQAFFLGSNGRVDSGFFQSQTGSSFTNASANGTYAFGTIDPEGTGVSDNSGFATFDGVSSVSGKNDNNSAGSLTPNQTFGPMSYSIDSTGLVHIPSGCTISATSTTCQTIAYVISPTKAVVMDVSSTNTNPNIQVADQ